MPAQYYGIGVQSMTSQVAGTEMSAVVNLHGIAYTKQRVGIVFQTCTAFIGNSTQMAYVANFTTSIIPGVAQLI
jgi:hypothetical protein